MKGLPVQFHFGELVVLDNEWDAQVITHNGNTVVIDMYGHWEEVHESRLRTQGIYRTFPHEIPGVAHQYNNIPQY